jgi:outer membrane protein OmpA-like peptidoglycan-associated protein
VYDTLREHPDTIKVQAKIIFQSIPHGNEIGIITSDINGYFEYFVNLAYDYRLNVQSDNHRKHAEVMDPNAFLENDQVFKNFYLTPELKENQVIRLNKLIFEQGQSSITSTSFHELNRLVDIMNEQPGMQIQLEGHTDYRGSRKLNMELSKERVKAVKDYLVGMGVRSRRIKTKAFGGSKPLIKEQSIEASEINRRVEVRILKL